MKNLFRLCFVLALCSVAGGLHARGKNTITVTQINPQEKTVRVDGDEKVLAAAIDLNGDGKPELLIEDSTSDKGSSLLLLTHVVDEEYEFIWSAIPVLGVRAMADCSPYAGDAPWQCLGVVSPLTADHTDDILGYRYTLYAYVKEAYIERRYADITFDEKTLKPCMFCPYPWSKILYESQAVNTQACVCPVSRGR